MILQPRPSGLGLEFGHLTFPNGDLYQSLGLRGTSYPAKANLNTSRHFADVIHAAAKSLRKQQTLIDEMSALIATNNLIPQRPGRSEPRAKKRRPKNFQLLTKPRSQMGNLPHRNRQRPNYPKSTLS